MKSSGKIPHRFYARKRKTERSEEEEEAKRVVLYSSEFVSGQLTHSSRELFSLSLSSAVLSQVFEIKPPRRWLTSRNFHWPSSFSFSVTCTTRSHPFARFYIFTFLFFFFASYVAAGQMLFCYTTFILFSDVETESWILKIDLVFFYVSFIYFCNI